jgi:hypothetical protein
MDSETKADLKPEYEALQMATKKALAEKNRKK